MGEPGETLRQVLSTLANGSNGDAPAELVSVLSGPRHRSTWRRWNCLLDGEKEAPLSWNSRGGRARLLVATGGGVGIDRAEDHDFAAMSAASVMPVTDDDLTHAAPRAFAGADTLSWTEMLLAPVRWPRPTRLQEPLHAPTKKASAALQALGLHTVGDLLEHLPRDSREARTVAELRVGEQATVAVEVRSIATRPVRKRGSAPWLRHGWRMQPGRCARFSSISLGSLRSTRPERVWCCTGRRDSEATSGWPTMLWAASWALRRTLPRQRRGRSWPTTRPRRG